MDINKPYKPLGWILEKVLITWVTGLWNNLQIGIKRKKKAAQFSMVFSRGTDISSFGALLVFYSHVSGCLKHVFLFNIYFYYTVLQNQIIFRDIIVI